MKYTQSFIIENRFLGQVPRSSTFAREQVVPPTSDLYFCRHCGEVFARCPVVSADGVLSVWQSYSRCCSKCHFPYAGDIPGSIWRSWDNEFIIALPIPVLKWELERHLNWYDKKEQA